jgi:hypothetical protein
MRPVLDRFILRRKETTATSYTSRQNTSYHERFAPAADTFELTGNFWVRNSEVSMDGEDYKDSRVVVKRDWEVHDEVVSTTAGMF